MTMINDTHLISWGGHNNYEIHMFKFPLSFVLMNVCPLPLVMYFDKNILKQMHNVKWIIFIIYLT